MLTEIRGELWFSSKGLQKKRVLVNVNHVTKRVRVISQPGIGGAKRVTTVFEGRYTSIKATMGSASVCCEPISTHMSQQCNCYTPRSAVNNSTSGKWYPIDITLETQSGTETLSLSTNRKSEFKRWQTFLSQICPPTPSVDQSKMAELQEENKRHLSEVDVIISAASSAKEEVQKLSMEAELKDLQRKLDLRGAALREAELERHEEVAFYKREIRLLRELHGASPSQRDSELSPLPRTVSQSPKTRHQMNRLMSHEESERQAISSLYHKSVTDSHLLLKTILSKLRKIQTLPTSTGQNSKLLVPASPHSPSSSTSGSPNGKFHCSITDDVLERDKALAAEERMLSATGLVERCDSKPWVVVSDTPINIYPSNACTEGSELRVVHRGTVVSVSAQTRKYIQVFHEADGYLTGKDDLIQTSVGDWFISNNGANLCIGLKTHYLPPRTPVKHLDSSCMTKPRVTVALEGYIKLTKPACVEPILGDGWIVTGCEGVTVRATPSLESRIVGSEPVPFGTTVYITDIVFGRARIVYPLVGWVSISNKRNVIILEKASSQRQGQLERQIVSERTKLETELSSVKDDLLSLNDQLVALQESNDTQVQTYETNISNLSSELIMSRKEAQTSESEKEKLQAAITQLKSQIAEHEQKGTELQNQLETDINSRRRAYAQLVDEKTEIEEQLQQSKDEIESWEKASKETEEKILRLMAERDVLSKKLLQTDETFQKEIAEHKEQYEILSAEKDLCQNNLQSLQQEMADKSEQHCEAENGLRETIKDLQQQLEEQSSHHTTAMESLSQSQSQQLCVENDLRETIKLLQNDLSDHKTAYKTSANKVSTMQEQLSEQDAALCKLKKKITKTADKLKAAENECEDKSAQIEEMLSQHEIAAKALESDLASSREREATLEASKGVIQEEVNQMCEQLERLETDKQNLIATHTTELTALNTKVHDLENDNHTLTKSCEEQLQALTDDHEATVTQLVSEHDTVRLQLTELEHLHQSLQKDYSDLQITLSAQSDEVLLKAHTDLEKKAMEVETLRESLQQSKADQQLSEVECERQAAEIQSLRAQLHSDLSEQGEVISQLEGTNEELEAQLGGFKEKLRQVESELLSKVSQINALEERTEAQRISIENLAANNSILTKKATDTTDLERQIAVLTAVNVEKDSQLTELSATRQSLYAAQQQLLVKEQRIKHLEDNEKLLKLREPTSPDSVHVRQVARLEDKVAIQRKMVLKLQHEIDEKEEELSRMYEEKKQIRKLLREEREENDLTGRKTSRLSRALQEMEDRERALRARLSKCEVDKTNTNELKQKLKESEAACRLKDKELRRLEEWNAQQVCERAKENELMWKSEASNTSILGEIISNTATSVSSNIDEEFAVREQNDKLKAKLAEATSKYKNLKRETRSRSAMSSRASSASRGHSNLSTNLRSAACDIENRWTNSNLDTNSVTDKDLLAKNLSEKRSRRSTSLTSVASLNRTRGSILSADPTPNVPLI